MTTVYGTPAAHTQSSNKEQDLEHLYQGELLFNILIVLNQIDTNYYAQLRLLSPFFLALNFT